MATKRKKRRHRGAAGKANADLTAHIRSLGLTGVAQYQTWCRDHGLNRALNKGWQARRRERAIAERAIDAELSERELLQHIRELGLKTVADYADCADYAATPSRSQPPLCPLHASHYSSPTFV